MQISSTNEDGWQIEWRTPWATRHWNIDEVKDGDTARLRFYTEDNNNLNWQEKVTIKDNWNVWIWTTDPQAKLDVNGNTKINWKGYFPLHINTDKDGGLVITHSNDWNKRVEYSTRWDGWFRIYQWTLGGDIISSDRNWNVWIWTTDPKAKLDVNGDMNVRWNIYLKWKRVATINDIQSSNSISRWSIVAI